MMLLPCRRVAVWIDSDGRRETPSSPANSSVVAGSSVAEMVAGPSPHRRHSAVMVIIVFVSFVISSGLAGLIRPLWLSVGPLSLPVASSPLATSNDVLSTS